VRKIPIVAFVVVALAAAPALASATGTASHAVGHHSGHGGTLPAAVFLPKAAAANQFEIVTGQLAQQKASSSAIKDLGAMFVTDHTAGLKAVTDAAAALGVTLPSSLPPKQQAIVDELSGLSGEEFDAAFVQAQIPAHFKALRLYLLAAIRGENAQVRAVGQGGLPVITKHLGELLDIAGDSGWSGGHHWGDHRS
jgi:putative membrane protein